MRIPASAVTSRSGEVGKRRLALAPSPELCIKDSSAKTVLYACDGTATELWTRHSNGEYVIRYNGQCLTEPSANNGSQLTLATCKDTTRQHWSLP